MQSSPQQGKNEDWDLYLNGVQLAMNIKYFALHKSRPYTILFGKAPNGFTDYSKITPTLSTEKADSKLLDARLEFAQKVVIPQIAKLIKKPKINNMNVLKRQISCWNKGHDQERE